MLRQAIKIGAVMLTVGGVFVYAVLDRQLGALRLRHAVPPIGDAFERLIDAREALPDAIPVIGQRDADVVVDPSHV